VVVEVHDLSGVVRVGATRLMSCEKKSGLKPPYYLNANPTDRLPIENIHSTDVEELIDQKSFLMHESRSIPLIGSTMMRNYKDAGSRSCRTGF
jgi:hypothetical protein